MNLKKKLFFSEKIIFWGYEDFVDILLGHHKIGLYLGVISVHLRGIFLRSRYRIGDIFGVGKISNTCLGCLKFLIFLGGWTVDAGPEPTYEEKMRVPPGN